MNRRKFIRNTFWGTIGVGFASGMYAWQIEPFWLEIVKRRMAIKNLPNYLVGKTLMQISDIHVGNRFDYQFIIDSFKEAQQLDPDIVVYTGDYVSYENSEQIKQLERVLQNAVTGKLGTIAILGNHDYGHNWASEEVAEQVVEQLENANINVLRNEKTNINGLSFIGMDDYWGPNFDTTVMNNLFIAGEANIVLCHNPDVCDLDVWNNYNSWILSGHTHGGQCKPPFLKAPMLPVKNKRYSQGEVHLQNGRTLYINRALGHLWQIRFNVRPEITVFTLDKV